MAKQSEQVQEIPISELFPFKDHPFRVLDDEAMQRTVESISQFGVLAPAIARPRPEGGYEIIAGHRRLHASQLLGLETMPVLVRQMDDDTAIITMVDSNLQRETMLPSERARAYKMKMDAMARRAGRPSKENSGQRATPKPSKLSQVWNPCKRLSVAGLRPFIRGRTKPQSSSTKRVNSTSCR